MMTAWRLVRTRYARSAFDGEGARLYGGRWNSEGTGVVYLAQAISLALLEILVHLEGEGLLGTYSVFKVEFDERLVQHVPPRSLPPQWKSFPPPPATQNIGDAWVQAGRSPVLRVPSVIVDRESNFLLNPRHPAFKRIAIGPEEKLRIDKRLFKTFASIPRAN
ncbi:MAG: RES family NAD+ phosphorylase [Bacteroidota bacterium]